jgi:mannose-6-phosphate isomerase
LKEGNSALIPAAITDYDVIPLNSSSKLLDAFIDNKDRSLPHKVTRFLHISQK